MCGSTRIPPTEDGDGSKATRPCTGSNATRARDERAGRAGTDAGLLGVSPWYLLLTVQPSCGGRCRWARCRSRENTQCMYFLIYTAKYGVLEIGSREPASRFLRSAKKLGRQPARFLKSGKKSRQNFRSPPAAAVIQNHLVRGWPPRTALDTATQTVHTLLARLNARGRRISGSR